MECKTCHRWGKGALVGGVIFFVWMSISWMVIGWHQSYMKQLPNEAAVALELKSQVKEDGLYVFPYFKRSGDKAAFK